MSIIELKNVIKTYYTGSEKPVHALRGINLKVEAGESIAIQGVSGSGKSTLLNILGCLDALTEGEYYLDGEKVQFSNNRHIADIRNKKIGFVLQNFGLLNDRYVSDNIALPLLLGNMSKSKADKLAMEAAKSTGIEKLYGKKIKKLSGGERQRVAIARAIVTDPELILADEPTGSLDKATGEQVVEMLVKMTQSGKTVIIVTHDDSVAERCGRRLYIEDGFIREVI